jgi:hypothetical protein
MGYLNNASITVDAILTKKGRELLARGRDEFKITQFALADDEIDYDLWNPDHPLGTAYYGVTIENMPLIEALPDETQMMKYKLVTLPKKITRIPVVQVAQTNLTLNTGGVATIVPMTINFTQGNRTFGYTAILSDSDAAFIRVTQRASTRSTMATIPQFIGDNEPAQTVTVTGLQFQVIAKPQPAATKKATVTIIGNETGGRTTITLTVQKQNLETTPGVSLQAQ